MPPKPIFVKKIEKIFFDLLPPIIALFVVQTLLTITQLSLSVVVCAHRKRLIIILILIELLYSYYFAARCIVLLCSVNAHTITSLRSRHIITFRIN